jgi:hypothetical protein
MDHQSTFLSYRVNVSRSLNLILFRRNFLRFNNRYELDLVLSMLNGRFKYQGLQSQSIHKSFF